MIVIASGDPPKSGAPQEPRKAYPAGRRLTPQEVTRSVIRHVTSDAPEALAARMRMSPCRHGQT